MPSFSAFWWHAQTYAAGLHLYGRRFRHIFFISIGTKLIILMFLWCLSSLLSLHYYYYDYLSAFKPGWGAWPRDAYFHSPASTTLPRLDALFTTRRALFDLIIRPPLTKIAAHDGFDDVDYYDFDTMSIAIYHGASMGARLPFISARHRHEAIASLLLKLSSCHFNAPQLRRYGYRPLRLYILLNIGSHDDRKTFRHWATTAITLPFALRRAYLPRFLTFYYSPDGHRLRAVPNNHHITWECLAAQT